jgi:hypothetical protein
MQSGQPAAQSGYQLVAQSDHQPAPRSDYQSLAPPAPSAPQEPKAALVPVKIKTGIIRRKGKGKPVATLKIAADGRDYAIRLVDKKSKTEVLMAFIAANQTLETKVPLGSYRILAATGDEWYGDRLLFGPSTDYFVLHRVPGDDEFQFTFKGHTVYGNDIRLTGAVGGTLSTVPVTPNDFR